MGWPFEEASWSVVEGAYHTAMGTEMVWIMMSVVACVLSLVVGSKHELDCYKRAQNGQ